MVDKSLPSAVPHVLIMNCHYNGLSLIQALGRRGIPVVAVDSKKGIGARSRYGKYLQVPDPAQDRESFIEELCAFGERLSSKSLIIPTNDHWAEALAWGAGRLNIYYHLCVSDIHTVELLLDKERFGRWAEAHGLQTPKIWSSSEAVELADSLVYPVAVKANSRRRSGQFANSTDWSHAADRLRFEVCGSAVELQSAIKTGARHGVPVFCQQVVKGKSDAMRTIGVYARAGRAYGLLYGRKIRGFPAAYGDCIVGQAEPVPEWARDLAVKCCELLDYTGIAELEVMVDAETGERFLIEINPRSWSWVGVGPSASADLGWIAYQDMVGGVRSNETIEGCADGQPVFYAKAFMDLQNCGLWYRFSSAPEWVMSPFVWWRSFRGKKGVFAEFSSDDPWITVYSLFQAARTFIGRALKVMRGHRFV